MPEVVPGQLRRKRLLGSEAVYHVVSGDAEHVVVEVIRAPGLEPGERIRMLRPQVEEMQLVEESPPPA